MTAINNAMPVLPCSTLKLGKKIVPREYRTDADIGVRAEER